MVFAPLGISYVLGVPLLMPAFYLSICRDKVLQSRMWGSPKNCRGRHHCDAIKIDALPALLLCRLSNSLFIRYPMHSCTLMYYLNAILCPECTYNSNGFQKHVQVMANPRCQDRAPASADATATEPGRRRRETSDVPSNDGPRGVVSCA